MDVAARTVSIRSSPRYFWYPVIAGGFWMGLVFGALLSVGIMLFASGGWDVLAITWLFPAFGFGWSIPKSFWWRRLLGATSYEFRGDELTITGRRRAPITLSLMTSVQAVRLTGSPPRVLDVVLDKGSMVDFPAVDVLTNGKWIYGPKFTASAAELDTYSEQIAAAAGACGVRFSRS